MSRVLFGGKALREPTAASRLRIGVQPAVNPNATNRVAVLGPSEGGLPHADGSAAVYTFSSYQEALEVLRSGDSLRAIYSIFNPSPAFPGAAQVDFVRAEAATAASQTFDDATVNAALTVTTVDKGLYTNGFWMGIAVGTVDNTARVITLKVPGATIASGTDGVSTNVSTDYFFESASARFISKGAATGDVIVVRSSDSTTVTHYTIKSVISETMVQLNETIAPASSLIWSHTRYARTQISPELSATAVAGAINQNLVNWLNDNAGDVVTATVGAAGTTIAAAASGAFTGGTVTAGILSDIEGALTLLENRQVQHIYVARACGTGAGELSFAGALTGHILNNAEIPAIAYIGAAADKSDADAITYAAALNSGRIVYAHQTVLDTSTDGLGVEEVPGYLFVAKVAGLAAGLPAQTPLTRKSLNILGLKNPTLSKATRESLLDAGILHVFQPAGSNTFVINQGVTTLQKNDELWDAASASSSEISLMRIVDSVLTDLRLSAAETFIGQTSTLAKPVVEHFVQSYLESQVGGLLQSYSGVTITQNQDKWYIQFGIVPAYPINFVLITGTVIG